MYTLKCDSTKIKCTECLYRNSFDSIHTHHTLRYMDTHATHTLTPHTHSHTHSHHTHTHTTHTLTHTLTHTHTLAGICLAASSSEIQFNWLRVLQGAGLTVLPAANEVDDLVKNASSIFDFEVKDSDGQLVPLERYR